MYVLYHFRLIAGSDMGQCHGNTSPQHNNNHQSVIDNEQHINKRRAILRFSWGQGGEIG